MFGQVKEFSEVMFNEDFPAAEKFDGGAMPVYIRPDGWIIVATGNCVFCCDRDGGWHVMKATSDMQVAMPNQAAGVGLLAGIAMMIGMAGRFEPVAFGFVKQN